MQEILIDKEQVYEGVYHVHWEVGGMRVVTDFIGEQPVTEKWSTGFPPTFKRKGSASPAYSRSADDLGDPNPLIASRVRSPGDAWAR